MKIYVNITGNLSNIEIELCGGFNYKEKIEYYVSSLIVDEYFILNGNTIRLDTNDDYNYKYFRMSRSNKLILDFKKIGKHLLSGELKLNKGKPFLGFWKENDTIELPIEDDLDYLIKRYYNGLI